MRIVTIRAAHLAFANRVVIGKIGFGILLLVTPEAVLIYLPSRVDRSRKAAVFATELTPTLAMNGVAVAALDVLRLVRARKPVANMVGFRVAAQANTIRLLGGTVPEADDLVFRLGSVPARRDVQTARPVALFAGNFLHRVRAPAVALGEVGMASIALLRPCRLCSWDVHELAEVLRHLVRRRCLGLAFVLGGKHWSGQQASGEQKDEEQNASLHSDLQSNDSR